MASVKVYSSPNCPNCKQVKEFFNKNKIAFEDIDITFAQKNAEEIMKKTGQTSVPLIEIDGKTIAGFDEKKLRKALNL